MTVLYSQVPGRAGVQVPRGARGATVVRTEGKSQSVMRTLIQKLRPELGRDCLVLDRDCLVFE